MAHFQLNGSLLKLVSKYIYIIYIYIIYIYTYTYNIYICTCIFKNVSFFCLSGEKKTFFLEGVFGNTMLFFKFRAHFGFVVFDLLDCVFAFYMCHCPTHYYLDSLSDNILLNDS